tara:strand:- start:143 stop:1093 length:951 start_codon:yes stop_codon:yes gene_type:complete
MADPIFSPDGKYMWTGNEWIPAPPESDNPSVSLQDSVVAGDINFTQSNDPKAISQGFKIAIKEIAEEEAERKAAEEEAERKAAEEEVLRRAAAKAAAKAAEEEEAAKLREENRIQAEIKARIEIEEHPNRIAKFEKKYNSIMEGPLMKICLFAMEVDDDHFLETIDSLLNNMNDIEKKFINKYYDLNDEFKLGEITHAELLREFNEEEVNMYNSDFDFLEPYIGLFDISQKPLNRDVDFCLVKFKGGKWQEGFVSRLRDSTVMPIHRSLSVYTLDDVKDAIVYFKKIRNYGFVFASKLEDIITSSKSNFSRDEWLD